MENLTRAARGHANLIQVTDRSNEQHLLLVTSESTLHDQTIYRTTSDRADIWVNAHIDVRMQYLDGPLLRLNSGMWPTTKFTGTVKSEPGDEDNTWHQSVRLSGGYVVIELSPLLGLGLGTYLFTQVIRWAQQVAPQADVQPIRLYRHQSDDPINKKRRNAFYERFGLEFDYRSVEGIEDAEGSSRAIKVIDLQIPVTPPRLLEFPLPDTLRKHYKDLRYEQERVKRELQRYRDVEAEFLALVRDTNWAVRFGRWRHRVRNIKAKKASRLP